MLPKEAGLTQQETYLSLRRRLCRWQRRSDATGVGWNTPVESLRLGMVLFPFPASQPPWSLLTASLSGSLLQSLIAKPEQVGGCPHEKLVSPACCLSAAHHPHPGEQDLEKPGPCSNAALSRWTDQQSTGLSTVRRKGLSVFRHPRRSIKGAVV